MTQSEKMVLVLCLSLVLSAPLPAQKKPPLRVAEGRVEEGPVQTAPAAPEEFKVYSEHPRLLVPARRLKLLRRERERRSMRWEQFQNLITGKAEMPERGFALALYYLASEDAAIGKQAVEWALSPAANDLHQLALVYDWCQPILTESQQQALSAKLVQGMERDAQKDSVSAVRSRVLAAVALFDHVPALPEKTLQSFWKAWWMGKMVPSLRSNRGALAHTDAYALMEILHVVKDNLNFDMRDNALAFFKDFPFHRVLSYYPAVYPAAENQYRIPMYAGLGEPDLNEAALSRAADLSIVAFDSNALEHQFVQGWLIQDQFLMRGAYGSPYEFLWANPYQPGLSYHHLPNFYHDPKSGILFLRSSWEPDAIWLAYKGGDMELFMDGKRSGLKPRAIKEPLQIGDHVIMVGESPMQFSLNLTGATRYFLVGLKPNTVYELEVDDEELREVRTDAGGILALNFGESINVGVSLKDSKFQR